MLSADFRSVRKMVHGLTSQVERQRHLVESQVSDGDRRSAITVLHLLEEELAAHQDRLEALRRLGARH